MSYRLQSRFLVLALTGALLPFAFHFHQAAQAKSKIQNSGSKTDYVWLEAEAFTSSNVAKPNIGGWGHPEWLSGDKWLQISIDADKLDKEAPGDGVLLTYEFSAPKQAGYEALEPHRL